MADRPVPSEELVEKVIRIAQTKDAVRWKYRGLFNQFGLVVRRRVMNRYRKTAYRVSGKFLPMLILEEDWRNPGRPAIITKKYKPGDWEQNLDKLYEFSEAYRQEHREDPEVFSIDVVT